MIKHGQPPYLECSTKGDRRFSPFCCYIMYGDKFDSIENHYQRTKVFSDGTYGLDWRQAKGRTPVNQAFCSSLYSILWDKYIEEHPELLLVLKQQTGLSDMFAREGYPCQATELWRIRNKSK